jgi:hypothetical protein
MSMGMPAIQEMPDEDASAQNSPLRMGNSPNKVTDVAPQISGVMNAGATNGSKQEEPVIAADAKSSKFSIKDGEDPKLE